MNLTYLLLNSKQCEWAAHYVWFSWFWSHLKNVKKYFHVVARLPQRLKSTLLSGKNETKIVKIKHSASLEEDRRRLTANKSSRDYLLNGFFPMFYLFVSVCVCFFCAWHICVVVCVVSPLRKKSSREDPHKSLRNPVFCVHPSPCSCQH